MHIISSSIIILIVISIIVLAVIFDVITGKTYIKTARLHE